MILGAGLDTRTWRLPHLDTTVFEVDHPTPNTTSSGCSASADFNLGRLDTTIAQAGFDPAVPTLFLWKGTTNYLSADAVDATLRWCARSAAGSQLVFTHIDNAVLTDPGRYVGADQLFSTLRRAHEPMTFGLVPEALPHYLSERA